jgi:hypothetical protein
MTRRAAQELSQRIKDTKDRGDADAMAVLAMQVCKPLQCCRVTWSAATMQLILAHYDSSLFTALEDLCSVIADCSASIFFVATLVLALQEREVTLNMTSLMCFGGGAPLHKDDLAAMVQAVVQVGLLLAQASGRSGSWPWA